MATSYQEILKRLQLAPIANKNRQRVITLKPEPVPVVSPKKEESPIKGPQMQLKTGCPKCDSVKMPFCIHKKAPSKGTEQDDDHEAQKSKISLTPEKGQYPWYKPENAMPKPNTYQFYQPNPSLVFAPELQLKPTLRHSFFTIHVPALRILQEFEKFLTELAQKMKTTVPHLKAQGYDSHMRGSTLEISTPNQAMQSRFIQQLTMLQLLLGNQPKPRPQPNTPQAPAPSNMMMQR